MSPTRSYPSVIIEWLASIHSPLIDAVDATRGIKQVDGGIRLVGSIHDSLGYFDLEQKTRQPPG